MSVTRLSNAKGWLSHGMWSRGVWQRGRLRWAHVAMYIGGGAQAGTDNEFFPNLPDPAPRNPGASLTSIPTHTITNFGVPSGVPRRRSVECCLHVRVVCF